MKDHKNFCNKCILSEGFLGIHLNSDGLCNFCVNSNYKNINYSRTIISPERRSDAQKDWSFVVKNM
ncbi:MAG: hypothetical protein HWN81_04605 [Candidatus Lokiarchaeota archaeon]|nr:hypothetical protein [Candidatus Lokiarchaeota archaeon]